MEKDKKYNVVLGLMIFLFILVVGISLAWGLSSISKEDNKEDIRTENVGNNNDSEKEEIVKNNDVKKDNNEVVTQNNVVKEDIKQEITTNNTTSNKKEEVNNSSNNVKLEENVPQKEEPKVETEKSDEELKEDIQNKIDKADVLGEIALIHAEVTVANLNENGVAPYTGYINQTTLQYTDSANGIDVKTFYENKLREKGYNVEVVVDSSGNVNVK